MAAGAGRLLITTKKQRAHPPRALRPCNQRRDGWVSLAGFHFTKPLVRPQAGSGPPCLHSTTPIAGRSEIGAHFASFNFPDNLICTPASSALAALPPGRQASGKRAGRRPACSLNAAPKRTATRPLITSFRDIDRAFAPPFAF